jgi:hypothetical protein
MWTDILQPPAGINSNGRNMVLQELAHINTDYYTKYGAHSGYMDLKCNFHTICATVWIQYTARKCFVL